MADKTPIRVLCEQYGMTQSAFAKRFQIRKRNVEKWCAGDRNPPDYVVGMMQELLEVDAFLASIAVKSSLTPKDLATIKEFASRREAEQKE